MPVRKFLCQVLYFEMPWLTICLIERVFLSLQSNWIKFFQNYTYIILFFLFTLMFSIYFAEKKTWKTWERESALRAHTRAFFAGNMTKICTFEEKREKTLFQVMYMFGSLALLKSKNVRLLKKFASPKLLFTRARAFHPVTFFSFLYTASKHVSLFCYILRISHSKNLKYTSYV